jgi:DNA-binding transcriptional ArsR family regulator
MSDKIIHVDLDDERIGKIADAISNKTCKKLLELLVDEEMSASQIADKLKLPLNTITYNLDILVESGLVDKSSEFLWSEKGKRIVKYKVADKKIVISPKSKFKGILASVLVSGLIALGIKYWSESNVYGNDIAYSGMQKGAETAFAYSKSSDMVASSVSSVSVGEPALWFLFGALVALIILFLFNWRKVL